MNAAKYREVLEENLLQSARDLRPGRQLDFQHDNEPDHPAKTTLERPLVVLPKPGLEPYRKSVERPEDGNSRGSARKNDINFPDPGGKACRDLPKKTQSSYCCQRGFYKALN
ncbi:hypothetical protein VZT92_018962 [Zoarces viviparus]|uniref:Uncharacterized protein n=1 Tax=Zoarces viviparus TaxID=48416 RepID=A0AAW1EKG2_ZOAVI